MILSRKIAAKNQYPAIDVLGSLSRVMSQIVPREHAGAAGNLRMLMSKYDEIEMLMQVGEYRPGNDAVADIAAERIGEIREFLGQRTDELMAYEDILGQLAQVVR